jgi:hypothetical protein
LPAAISIIEPAIGPQYHSAPETARFFLGHVRMAAELFYLPFRPALNANGLTVSGAQLYFYATGTTTLQPVYTTSALSTPLANPVTANAAGRWPQIYFDNALSYRVVLKDSLGTVLADVDPYLLSIADSLTTDLQNLADGVSANTASAAGSATLAGHYANDSTDTDVPGGGSGSRGAKYYALIAGTALSGSLAAQSAAETARDDILNDTGFQLVAADLAGADTIGTVASNMAAVVAAPTAATDAAAARDSAIATAASVGTSAVRQPEQFTALSDTTWTKTIFGVSSTRVTSAPTTGGQWFGIDVGTDVVANDIMDALPVGIAVASGTTSLRVHAWKVATTDTNVNSGPPQTNDVLVFDQTFALSAAVALDGGANGIVAGATEREFALPFASGTSIVFEAGKTYKFLVESYDASSALTAMNLGTRTVTATGRQRRNGGFRSTPSSGTFTNRPTTALTALGVLRRKLTSTSGLTAKATTNTASASAVSQTRLAAMNRDNDNLLFTASLLFPKVLSDAVTDTGDSLIANAVGTGGYTATAQMAPFITATLNNLGVVGTTSSEIRAAFLAMGSGQKDDYGFTNGGTNDANLLCAGVTSATITAAGSGGTDNTYTVPTIGGTAPSGKTVTQASYSVTVSGGAITAATPITIGGNFLLSASPPTFDLSGIPGLTGATLTPVLNLYGSVISNIADIMTAGGARRMLQGPWSFGTAYNTDWAICRAVTAWERTTYGARAFDGLAFLMRFHSGSETGLTATRRGKVPGYLTSDSGTHPNDNGVGILARERARMIRALAGIGAPYIHDLRVGAKQLDAAGTALGTLSILGTQKGLAIVDGNPSDQVRIDNTGALTRGAGTLDSVNEIFVQGDSLGLGRTNTARVIVVRQMDGTSPQSIVRALGNGASCLGSPGLTGGGPTKQLTVVMCARYNSTALGNIVVQGQAANTILSQSAYQTRFFARTASAAISNITAPYPLDPFDFNFYFFTIDTTSGVQSIFGAANESTTTGAVAGASADALLDMSQGLALFDGSSGAVVNFDLKMLWLGQGFIDLSNPVNRALFYNPTTRAPLDLGAAGTVSGLTPLVYFCGMAGDYMLGSNRGTGGKFYAPPHINLANVGFTDLSS